MQNQESGQRERSTTSLPCMASWHHHRNDVKMPGGQLDFYFMVWFKVTRSDAPGKLDGTSQFILAPPEGATCGVCISGPACRTRGSILELRVAPPHVRMGRLLPGPPLLLEKGTRWRREHRLWLLVWNLLCNSEESSCPGPPRVGGWLPCSSQAGPSPRATLVSLGYGHTLSCAEPWWASRNRVATHRKRPRHNTGRGREDRASWNDDLPKPPAPGSSRGLGSLPSSF